MCALVIGLYVSVGFIQTTDINNTCLRNTNDIRDAPFYCQCYSYSAGANGWETNINFVNPITGVLEPFDGVYSGKASTLTPFDVPDIKQLYIDAAASASSWAVSVANIDPAVLSTGDTWISHNPSSVDGDLCSAIGSKRGRTISFLTAVFCEALRPYTVRSWGSMFPVFNRSMWLHVATITSFVLTIILTLIPGVMDIFGVATLPFWHYLLAIGWSLFNLVADEYIPKPLYRKFVAARELKANDIMRAQMEDDKADGITFAD